VLASRLVTRGENQVAQVQRKWVKPMKKFVGDQVSPGSLIGVLSAQSGLEPRVVWPDK
jgi:hypothetical protein